MSQDLEEAREPAGAWGFEEQPGNARGAGWSEEKERME